MPSSSPRLIASLVGLMGVTAALSLLAAVIGGLSLLQGATGTAQAAGAFAAVLAAGTVVAALLLLAVLASRHLGETA